VFAYKKKRLRDITVGGSMPPKCHDQWIFGQLDISIQVTPERGHGDNHPDGGEEQTKEDDAILEKANGSNGAHAFG
jgi:hypothetical protein